MSKRARKTYAEHGNLDKAGQRHAEKQVQVATDGADQRVHGHLGLFLDLRHRERLVVEHEASQVEARKGARLHVVGLCGSSLGEPCVRRQIRLSIGGRWRPAARHHGRDQPTRGALQRTPAQTIDAQVVEVRAQLARHGVHACMLGLAKRHVCCFCRKAKERGECVAAALGHEQHLIARLDADILRVGVAGGARHVSGDWGGRAAVTAVTAATRTAVATSVAGRRDPSSCGWLL